MKCYMKDYPRTQFVRTDWENLNGTWDFAFDDANIGEKERWYDTFNGNLKIQVPFTYETKMSGIGDETRHDNVWYRKIITVDGAKLEKNNLLIHFEGSDYITKLWVNGQYAGCHRGGYARFSFDISNLVKDGENEIIVKAEDSFDVQQPRGKQRWRGENFNCWYVQTTGIWKTVWTEYAPKVRIESVKMTPNMEDFTLELELRVNAPDFMCTGDLLVETLVTFEGDFVAKNYVAINSDCVRTSIDMVERTGNRSRAGFEWSVKIWTPETPNLYDLEFRLINKGEVLDEVGSYVGMREIRIDGSNILLNNRPLYQRLILDQGYWTDSHLTPPSEEALIEDIDKIQALGYNGLRKHQKTEDERFLYWCDVKGMLVWSEMPSTYWFSDKAVTQFAQEWMEIVKQNYNHTCIITWTPLNESWGMNCVETKRMEQSFTEAIYHLTKAVDKMRPVIVNDGWEHTISDIITLHDYEENGETLKARYTECKDDIMTNEVYHCGHHCAFANGYEYKGQPIIISEYGGIAFSGGAEGAWGYGNTVTTDEAFIDRFDRITTAVKEIPYVCGFCYTQVSDVQQEINGLMDSDRNFKIDPKIIKEINERKIGYWRSFM